MGAVIEANAITGATATQNLSRWVFVQSFAGSLNIFRVCVFVFVFVCVYVLWISRFWVAVFGVMHECDTRVCMCGGDLFTHNLWLRVLFSVVA